jgi:thioesterase domain-containing protein
MREGVTGINIEAPFHLVGHSFEGMLAYEVARQLENKGLPVGILGIIDTGPADHSTRSWGNLLTHGYRFWRNLPNWAWHYLVKNRSKEMQTKIALNFRSFTRHLKTSLGIMSSCQKGPKLEEVWTPGTIPTHERPIWEASLRALYSYTPEAYGGRIALFRAKVRPLFHHLEPDLGWSTIGVGQVDVWNFPGDHLSIMREPDCRLVAEQLSELLNEASGDETEDAA